MLSRDRKSSRPLLTSLALELISRNLRRIPTNSSALERSEYASRDRDMLWYLLRDSIWQTWTRLVHTLLPKFDVMTYTVRRPKLESFADKTSNVPVVNLVSAFLKDWMPLIDEYHYCALCILCPVLHMLIEIHYRYLLVAAVLCISITCIGCFAIVFHRD